MRDWAIANLGISGEFDVLPTIGSKELVAWLPTFLESESVIYPEIAYPTYLVGAAIAGAQHSAVAIDASTWPKVDLAWVNSPSNPTGRVHTREEMREAVEYARRENAVVASDECYMSFSAGEKVPTSIFHESHGDNRNLLAVHSLSKRSNLAGYRAAFIVGDPALIARIREIRKHAGLMVPLPVQRAMTVALRDEVHVQKQAALYRARRETLRPALISAGFTIEESHAGLYIWCTRNESDWDSVKWFAERGVLVTPGHFYGEGGSRHIRIAMTATDAQIATVATRITEGN